MNKKLTREEAIRLHREMWQDMRAELGDDPCKSSRLAFKQKWVKEHFPNEDVRSNCFLCEYARHTDVARITDVICYGCPIAWNSHDVHPECSPGYLSFLDDGLVDYRYSPISEILALPERREVTRMSKIPVYLCNRKKCENGACELCHNTTDINYAERNTNDEPIVAYVLDYDELPFNYPNFKEVEK